MSKQIYTVTAETVISMIEEIHEEVTAVTMQSIGDVHTIILDSVAEDAEIECDIVAVITQWVTDNAEPVAQQGTGFETMSNAEMGFPVKIRTAAEIAEINAAVRIASQIAKQMSAEQLEVMVTSYDDMVKTIGTDAVIAMAMTFRKYAGK